MENKYYTPEIEEFCIGFEYEHLAKRYLWYLNGLGPKDEWLKETFSGGGGQDGETEVYELDHLIKDEAVRVKHLNREDIESFGWKDNEVHTGHAGEHYWIEKAVMKHGNRSQFEELHLIHQPYNGWVLIWQVMRLTIGDSDSVRFSGVIKNKSELKRILKQIGV
jgi:hypothetical protein